MGRDMLSRLVIGTRVSISVGLISVLISVLVAAFGSITVFVSVVVEMAVLVVMPVLVSTSVVVLLLPVTVVVTLPLLFDVT